MNCATSMLSTVMRDLDVVYGDIGLARTCDDQVLLLGFIHR
jgi:hypothetical protein